MRIFFKTREIKFDFDFMYISFHRTYATDVHVVFRFYIYPYPKRYKDRLRKKRESLIKLNLQSFLSLLLHCSIFFQSLLFLVHTKPYTIMMMQESEILITNDSLNFIWYEKKAVLKFN